MSQVGAWRATLCETCENYQPHHYPHQCSEGLRRQHWRECMMHRPASLAALVKAALVNAAAARPESDDVS